MSLSEFRTVLVFTDLPRHIEHQIGSWPNLQLGEEIEIDDLTIKNPKDTKRIRKLNGTYKVSNKTLKLQSKRSPLGLIQYLELSPVK